MSAHSSWPGLVVRPRRRLQDSAAMYLEQLALLVTDYDEAIDFFTRTLGFDLVHDDAALTNDGRSKRWVVVRPPGATTGILLAKADGPEQEAMIGRQFAGRAGLFLRVDDFEAARDRMVAAGVEFVPEPRAEPYGRVAVFRDRSGNRWDLLGPWSISCPPSGRRGRTDGGMTGRLIKPAQALPPDGIVSPPPRA